MRSNVRILKGNWAGRHLLKSILKICCLGLEHNMRYGDLLLRVLESEFQGGRKRGVTKKNTLRRRVKQRGADLWDVEDWCSEQVIIDRHDKKTSMPVFGLNNLLMMMMIHYAIPGNEEKRKFSFHSMHPGAKWCNCWQFHVLLLSADRVLLFSWV